ncbi:hypothetical protein PV325_004323, partial [Microctonus aethiopoides]
LASILQSDAVIGSEPIWSRGAQPRIKQFNQATSSRQKGTSAAPEQSRRDHRPQTSRKRTEDQPSQIRTSQAESTSLQHQ